MNINEKGEFEVMKNEINHIKTDVTEMKTDIKGVARTLNDHVKWEEEKYGKLDEKYVHKTEWEDFKHKVHSVENKIWDVVKIALPYILMVIILIGSKLI